MPIYEFECQKCSNKKELLVHNGFDKSPGKCECGGNFKKIISQSSFILKGTGWYATDYAKKDKGGSSEKKSHIKPTETKKIEKKEVVNASK
jgi:putative FmdB family regulatory protein